MAKSMYDTMCDQGKWTGVNTRGSHSTFLADVICWWCGAHGHVARDCPMPESERDVEKYKQRREAFRKQSRGGRGRGRGRDGGRGRGRGRSDRSQTTPHTGKWVPPSQSENKHRAIEVGGHMVMHRWDESKKQWFKLEGQGLSTGASTGTAPPSLIPLEQSVTSPPSAMSTVMQPTMAPESQGNIAAESMEAAAKAAQIAAATRSFRASMDKFITDCNK